MYRHEATADEIRILRAMSGMPCGALIKLERDPNEPLTLAYVASWMEQLQSILVNYTAEARENERALLDLRADVAAVRRVLGTRD